MTNFRWAEQLASMEVDLSLAAVTHTLEREVMEVKSRYIRNAKRTHFLYSHRMAFFHMNFLNLHFESHEQDLASILASHIIMME